MHSQIIEKMKASGIFDQFRKDCIADVDTKPAYINLHTRVNQSVDDYLNNIHWSSKMVRISVRDGMRKHIMESSYFTKGVDRIVNQAVDPKINTAFFPIVENVVYEYLGLQKPKQGEVNEEFEEDKKCWEQPMDIDPPEPPQESMDANEPDDHDLKPAFDAPDEMKLKVEEELSVSGEHDLIIVEDPVNEDEADDDAVEDDDEEESPPFEAIGISSPPHPFPATPALFAVTPPKPPSKSSDTEALVTDFSNYFSKPELEKDRLSNLSNNSPNPTESSQPIPTPEKIEQNKVSSSSISSCKEKESITTKSSPSEKDKYPSSSSKERGSSSSYSHSRTKTDSSYHSKHRDRDRESSNRDRDKTTEKDKYRRESSSSKHSSRASQSKHSRHSSHSTSSRRHSSDSRSKESGRNHHSDKNRKSSDDKTTNSSKQSHKEYKSSSSSRRETSSHSSSRKNYDKHKHSSVSSSRKSSSSRSSEHDHRGAKTKSSNDDKERADSHRDTHVISKKMKTDSYETPTSELEDRRLEESYIIKRHSPNLDSASNNTEQLSPDINEGGLGVVQDHSFPPNTSAKILSADQEETALDKWYNSGNENDNCDRSENFTSIAFASHHDPSNFDASESIHEEMKRTALNSDTSTRTHDLSESVSGVQRSSNKQEKNKSKSFKSTSERISSARHKSRRDSLQRKKRKGSVGSVSSDCVRSLDQLDSDDFNARRDYFSQFIDPFYDERSVPVPVTNNQLPLSKIFITLDDCEVNDNMVVWLRTNGARVHLKSCD